MLFYGGKKIAVYILCVVIKMFNSQSVSVISFKLVALKISEQYLYVLRSGCEMHAWEQQILRYQNTYHDVDFYIAVWVSPQTFSIQHYKM